MGSFFSGPQYKLSPNILSVVYTANRHVILGVPIWPQPPFKRFLERRKKKNPAAYESYCVSYRPRKRLNGSSAVTVNNLWYATPPLSRPSRYAGSVRGPVPRPLCPECGPRPESLLRGKGRENPAASFVGKSYLVRISCCSSSSESSSQLQASAVNVHFSAETTYSVFTDAFTCKEKKGTPAYAVPNVVAPHPASIYSTNKSFRTRTATRACRHGARCPPPMVIRLRPCMSMKCSNPPPHTQQNPGLNHPRTAKPLGPHY